MLIVCNKRSYGMFSVFVFVSVGCVWFRFLREEDGEGEGLREMSVTWKCLGGGVAKFRFLI